MYTYLYIIKFNMGQICRTIQSKIKNDTEINIDDCAKFDFIKFHIIKSSHTNKKKYKVMQITEDLIVKVVVYLKNEYQLINLSFNAIVFPSNTVDDEDEIQACLKAQDLIDQKLIYKYIKFDLISYCKEKNIINAIIYLGDENINLWTIQENIGISQSKIRSPKSWLQYQHNKKLDEF